MIKYWLYFIFLLKILHESVYCDINWIFIKVENLIEKASISINGISLTISKITPKGFQVWAIPHTLKLTNLLKIKKNDLVNIEIDIFYKYVRNYFNEK